MKNAKKSMNAAKIARNSFEALKRLYKKYKVKTATAPNSAQPKDVEAAVRHP